MPPFPLIRLFSRPSELLSSGSSEVGRWLTFEGHQQGCPDLATQATSARFQDLNALKPPGGAPRIANFHLPPSHVFTGHVADGLWKQSSPEHNNPLSYVARFTRIGYYFHLRSCMMVIRCTTLLWSLGATVNAGRVMINLPSREP